RLGRVILCYAHAFGCASREGRHFFNRRSAFERLLPICSLRRNRGMGIVRVVHNDSCSRRLICTAISGRDECAIICAHETQTHAVHSRRSAGDTAHTTSHVMMQSPYSITACLRAKLRAMPPHGISSKAVSDMAALAAS